MNWVTIGIGFAAVVYGLATIRARKSSPDSFWKLEPMKQNLGEKAGHRLHLVAYSVIPIVFGIITILAGVKGASLF